MRKVSILVLVVIFAGAMTVGVNAASDTASTDVLFETNSSITLTVESGNTVDFGDTLDPNAVHFEKQATKLSVSSNTDWEISYSKSGSAKSSLTVGLGSPSYGWDLVDNPSSFNTATNDTYSGTNDKSGINASYMLNDLKQLQEGTEHSVDVTFTATTQ
jgi:hypothetical protein